VYFTISSLYIEYPILNKTIEISKGSSVFQIRKKNWNKKEIISSATLFLVINKFLPADKQLKYGKFNFTGKYSFLDVLDKLTSGEVVTNRITVPEGYTVRRIASLLERQELADYSTFMSLCSDSSYIDSLGLPIKILRVSFS